MVRRTMHRHDAFFGQQIVQQGKDGLFVFARIFGTADQDHLAIKVQRNDGFAAAVVLGGVRLKAGAVDHGEIRDKAVQFFAFWAPQHGADEQTVPGQFGYHADVD